MSFQCLIGTLVLWSAPYPPQRWGVEWGNL